MSMYDRDWYRESYKEQEKKNRSANVSGSTSAGAKPILFILLFAIIMAAIMAAARLFVNYPATIGLIGETLSFSYFFRQRNGTLPCLRRLIR